VRLYVAPLLYLALGVLTVGFQVYVASSRCRARLSHDKLAEVQKRFNQRFITVWIGVAGLYCIYAAIRTVVIGVDTWWLWFLAAAVQLVAFLVRRFAFLKLGVVEVRPDVETQRGRRRALWLALLAFACLVAVQPVAETALRLDNGFIGVAAVVLMVAALAGFTAAGWVAVWKFQDRTPGKEPAPPPPHA